MKNPKQSTSVLGALALSALLVACEAIQPTPRSRTRSTEVPAVVLPERGFDVDHYAIDIVLYPERHGIEATCRVRFQATTDIDSIELDLLGLDVRAVDDGRAAPLNYFHDGKKLRVELDSTLGANQTGEVVVTYAGRPQTGLWFSGNGPDGEGPTQVFTQGQAEHNRGWFPCVDHPSDRATSEIRVTMPSDWIGVAAGDRVEVSQQAGTRVEHWKMPIAHPSYLVTLVAGEFVVKESTWNGVPLQFIVEPRYASWVDATFHETDEILSFLSEYTGVPYPYSKYSQACVANFPWGGMENISATTLTPLTLGDEKVMRDSESTGLVAHEAAHQWFGDYFTCADWSHIWLNEGFATYMTMLYFEKTRGVDEFRVMLREAQDAYVKEDRGLNRRPTVARAWNDPEDLMDTRAYQGAAARLHLLRTMLGDDVFQEGVRTFVAENAGRSVVTADLERAMEKVSGQDLDEFFDQWFYGRGFPEFDVAWEWDARKQVVEVDVRQTQDTVDGTPAAFRTPVDIEVFDETGSTIHRLEITRRNQVLEIPAPFEPVYVTFDKYGAIPKTLVMDRRDAEWRILAVEDDDVNARCDALAELGEQAARERERGWVGADTDTIIATLVHRTRMDRSPHVRAAAARALGRAMGDTALAQLMNVARSDQSALVRVAALEALRAFGSSSDIANLAYEVYEERYSYATMGAAAKLIAVADPLDAYLWTTEQLYEDSPHDVLRGYLFESLGTLPNTTVSQQLRSWAADETVHPNARAVALKTLAKRRREIVENSKFIASFLTAENFRLRRGAVEALADLGDDNARNALRAYYPRARSGERRVIEASFAGRSN